MKQIFVFVVMSVLKTVASGKLRTLAVLTGKVLHSEKFIVWCGVAFFVVIGFCLFKDEAGRAVTVNSTRHSEMLRIFLEPVLQRNGSETQTLWFVQGGVTAHNKSPIRDVPTSRNLTKREY
jgi:hypothetical protein